jgi:hypothetical protein
MGRYSQIECRRWCSSYIRPMVLQLKSGLGLLCLLPPQCSIISGQLPFATRRKLAASCYRTSSHLFLGFPTDHTPPNLALNTFMRIRVPSILWTCPAHWSLFSWYMLQGQVHSTVHTIPCCINPSLTVILNWTIVSSFQKNLQHFLNFWKASRFHFRRWRLYGSRFYKA